VRGKKKGSTITNQGTEDKHGRKCLSEHMIGVNRSGSTRDNKRVEGTSLQIQKGERKGGKRRLAGGKFQNVSKRRVMSGMSNEKPNQSRTHRKCNFTFCKEAGELSLSRYWRYHAFALNEFPWG